MKRMGMTAAAVALLFAFLLFCVGALVRYARPMNDASYDLSLAWAGEAMPSDWVYDQKGWRVFTMEGGERRELTANGFGGFYGDVEPDETFYYARDAYRGSGRAHFADRRLRPRHRRLSGRGMPLFRRGHGRGHRRSGTRGVGLDAQRARAGDAARRLSGKGTDHRPKRRGGGDRRRRRAVHGVSLRGAARLRLFLRKRADFRKLLRRRAHDAAVRRGGAACWRPLPWARGAAGGTGRRFARRCFCFCGWRACGRARPFSASTIPRRATTRPICAAAFP